MTLNELNELNVAVNTSSEEDEFSIPLDISDIINICKDFNSLGWQVQNQIENILEIGVEESIKSNIVKQQSLPIIKRFLQQVCKNPYFGDARSQANDCIKLIEQYEQRHKVSYIEKFN